MVLVIGPPVLGGVAGYVSYQYRHDRAIDAASAAAANASENTARLFNKYLLVAARIDDLLGARTPTQIRAFERAFHDGISRQIADMHEVAAAWVIDAAGRELVSARVYPVNPDLDQSGRDDYRSFHDTGARTFIWVLRARSSSPNADIEPYVTVSLRRTLPDGQFNGVVIVSIAGSYLTMFYQSLLASPDYIVDLVKSDGTVLVQFPASETAGQPQLPDPLLANALAGGETGIAERGTPFDSAGRLVAVARVADYPVYVAVERSKTSIGNEWLRSIAGVFAVAIAAMAVSIVLTRMMLRRASRETIALALAAEAFADRAALQVEVHRTQRLAGVALLTTGMAYEFDGFLRNARENIQRLEMAIKDVDAGQHSSIAALKDSYNQASMLNKRLLGYALRESIKPRPIDINEIIAQALERSRQFADSIPREVRLQKDLWLSCVDPDQLTMSLLNLMFNVRDVFGGTRKLLIETMNVRVDRSEIAKLQEGKPGEYVGLFIESPQFGSPLRTDETVLDSPLASAEPGKGGWFSLSLMHELARSSGGYWTVSSEPTLETTIRVYFPRYLANSDKAEHNPIRDEAGGRAPP